MEFFLLIIRLLVFLGFLLPVLTNPNCLPGYSVSLSECKDEDECMDPICGKNAHCHNTNGSYYCNCHSGYRANSVNFTAEQSQTCTDIDECEENRDVCGPHAICSNCIGSFLCICVSGFVCSDKQQHFKADKNLTCYNMCQEENICGPNADCTYTNGSSFCSCHSGFVASSMQENFNVKIKVQCNELKCDRLDGEHLSVQIPVELQQILDELKSVCMQKGATGEGMLDILIDALEGFCMKSSLADRRIVSALFQLVEVTLPVLGQLLVNRNISLSFPQTRVGMLVKRQPGAPFGPFTLSTDDVQFSSDWETATGESYPGFAFAALFEYTDQNFHTHLNTMISSRLYSSNSSANGFQLKSRVVTIEVTNQNKSCLKTPVTLAFSHLQDKGQEATGDVTCVFWDSGLEGGVWSNEGCSVVQTSTNFTVCSCKHLSSFAVLMALYEQKDVFELQLITWIGLGLSLICLLICILTFWLVRSIQSTRTIIHLHLCISLFIADLIFLIGIGQTQNKVGCALVAALLHYFFLAVFCWMCLEGVQLFRMVVLVFNTTLNRCYLMAAGYGVPALIVAISAGANYKGYGTPRYCWLNLESGFIWSFFGPVCLIIVVNAVFFLITVTKLAQKFNSINPDMNNLKKLKTFTITAIAQLCVLGTMWIFGCFQFDEGTLVMSYLFTILNSLQGALVFIMHCLLSKQVRSEYLRFLTCLTTRQKSSYSEFSTNQSSKSQTVKSSNNTGESRI